MELPDRVDVVVVGGGPAGLATGTRLAQAGRRVVVFERQGRYGIAPRGETIHSDASVEALLGPGFLDSIALHQVPKRRFWSPSTEKFHEMTVKDPNRVFRWADFMEPLLQAFLQAGGILAARTEVSTLLFETPDTKRIVRGVRYVQGNQDSSHTTRDMSAPVVVLATGSMSSLYKDINRPPTIDIPIVKVLAKAPHARQDMLEFFLVTAEQGGPGALFIFPRTGDQIETGFTYFPTALPPKVRPTEAECLAAWERLRQQHPVYQERLTDMEITYQTVTWLGVGGLVPSKVPLGGVFLVGDAAGEIEAPGMSGMAASVVLGMDLADTITSSVLPQLAKNSPEAYWSAQVQKKLHARLARHPRYKRLKRLYSVVQPFHAKFFRVTHVNSTAIDAHWKEITGILERKIGPILKLLLWTQYNKIRRNR